MNASWLTAFSPRGTLGRGAYLVHLGAAGIPLGISLGVSTFATMVLVRSHEPANTSLWLYTFGAGLALSCWLGFCAMSKRLHDMGRSGIWALTPLLVLGALAGWTYATQPDQRYSVEFGVSPILMFFFPAIYALFSATLALFPSAYRPNRYGDLGSIPRPQAEQTALPDIALSSAVRITPMQALLKPTIRLNRRDYFMALQVMSMACGAWLVLATLLLQPLFRALHVTSLGTPLIFVLMIAPALYMGLCVMANRLHDMGYRASWALAPACIYVAACAIASLGDVSVFQQLLSQGMFIFLLSNAAFGWWLMLAKGHQERNRFGPPTKLALK